jgi:hypothetical protein
MGRKKIQNQTVSKKAPGSGARITNKDAHLGAAAATSR